MKNLFRLWRIASIYRKMQRVEFLQAVLPGLHSARMRELAKRERELENELALAKGAEAYF